MPIGIIANASMVVLGGIIGTCAGHKLSESFKENLNCVFGACAMAMGISSIVLMKNMPAVILSIILGTAIGLILHMGRGINNAGTAVVNCMSKIFKNSAGADDESKKVMVTAIVLFCASGTGIYGSIVAGMTGDNSILLAKSILDLATAMIFACSLGAATCVIAILQVIIFMILFYLAGVIYPICTPEMIDDFKACGGILLVATGFRMIKVKEFPIADMIPAMLIVMPLSYLWSTYIMPFVS